MPYPYLSLFAGMAILAGIAFAGIANGGSTNTPPRATLG